MEFEDFEELFLRVVVVLGEEVEDVELVDVSLCAGERAEVGYGAA